MRTTAGEPTDDVDAVRPTDPGPGYRALARNSAIAAGAVVANGLLSAVILALCASFGQTGEIAAYTVVTSALAFVLIVVSGGSALLYLNGTEEQRTLVRSQWTLVVVPGLLLGVLVVGAFYAHRGYDATALAAAGVVALGNGLAQLQTADFSRRMRFLASAVLMCGSKAASLVMVLLGAPLTVALAAAGLTQLVVGEVVLGGDGSLRRERFRELSLRRALAGYRSSRHLFGFALGDLYVARFATLVLSLVATPAVMGSFGALITAYQAIGGVVQSALQVPMVARARRRLGFEYSAHPAHFSVVVALLCAVPMAAAVAWLAPWLTGTMLSLPHREAAGWLTLFMLALPFMAVSRALMFNWIGDGHYGRATRAMAVLAALLTVAVTLGVPRFGPLGAAAATAAAEVSALVVILLFARRLAGLAPAGRRATSLRARSGRQPR
ncbi:lipopolysaccharide biosynthesis protein [Micromonospora pisi]|uniref:lipopolysaccharide biosynthesis protein n=1 Tax=Micromonospora pisi TaxID=589240 RepID=UPI0011C3D338|nr:polysaccharide biosynthesis C-terminal domain-containing protein [Micromonospora pisi]